MITDINVRPVDKVDAEDIIRRTEYANKPDAGKALAEQVRMSSDKWVGEIDGEIVAIGGLITLSIISDQAYIWVLVTDRIKECPVLFLRKSKQVMDEFMKRYKVLTGMCEVTREDSIRWLKLLGATFFEPNGKTVRFEIRRKECS